MSICCGNIKAQNFALKTNIVYDATATVNIGAEIGLAPKWTFDLSGNYNAWEMPGDRFWKHAMAQPEVRFWFCDRFSRLITGTKDGASEPASHTDMPSSSTSTGTWKLKLVQDTSTRKMTSLNA